MSSSDPKISLTAYHGTTTQNANSILKNNFIIRFTPEDWLGYGVYFFVPGISCPIKNAEEWARNSHHHEPISVVKSIISAPTNQVLNLTQVDQLKIYNDTKNQVINDSYDSLKTRRDLTIKKRRDIRLDDRIITNLILEKLGIKILIHNTYIKNHLQRKLALESSYPNSTACCVTDLSLITSTEIHLSYSAKRLPETKNT
ncbi:hypothetical protein [Pseudomonas sp. SIMBA_021]|uniref:hypothetical protein n=1 Tax=unclassified Pseudomonas TaxID=196821 RepID=UPI00397DCB05